MKFNKALITLLLILISLTYTSSKIRTKNKIIYKNLLFVQVRTSTRGLVENLKAFALGIIQKLGGPNADPTQCLPAAWKSTSAAAASDEADKGASGQSSILNTIVNTLEKGIEAACSIKDVVINWLVGKIGRRRRLRRRVFVQMRKGFGDFLEGLGDDIVDVTKKSVKVVDKATDVVVDGVKQSIEAIKNAAMSLFNPIINKFKELMNKFTSFFRTPMYTQIEDFIKCVKGMAVRKKILGVVTNVVNFIRAISHLLSGFAGFAKVIIKAICNFGKFKLAVTYLMRALKTTGKWRWSGLGNFVGQLIVAIGSTA